MTFAAPRAAAVSGEEWLTEALLPAMRERVAALGLEQSGAYNFYRWRLDNDRVFLDYELDLVNAIAASALTFDGVHEIGCGWGQLVFLLAWQGHRAFGFECDRPRYASAAAFHARLRALDPARAGRVTIRCKEFPAWVWPKHRAELGVVTNLVNKAADTNLDGIIRGLTRYRYAIVDLDRFGRKRTPPERAALVARIEAGGLASRGVFLDLGESAHYHLFETAPKN